MTDVVSIQPVPVETAAALSAAPLPVEWQTAPPKFVLIADFPGHRRIIAWGRARLAAARRRRRLLTAPRLPR